MVADYSPSLIYEEKKITYWILGFTPVFFSILFFLYYLYERNELAEVIILPLVCIFIALFICINIAFYSIKIYDDKEIKFRFPLWEFGGLGWRIGRARKNGKWRIGYVMWLQKGVEIEATNGKYYVFGTNNPDEILSLLK